MENSVVEWPGRNGEIEAYGSGRAAAIPCPSMNDEGRVRLLDQSARRAGDHRPLPKSVELHIG